MRLRLCVHALDRTGPPVLARSLIDWFRSHRDDLVLDVVAFRGGPLLSEFVDRVPTTVALHPFEHWDGGRPSRDVAHRVRSRLEALEPVDATFLVSVSAAQVLPYLPGTLIESGPIVAWVVEQGEDLHWLDPPHAVGRSIDRWIAGSVGTRRALERCEITADIAVAPEFVDLPAAVQPDAIAARRKHLGVRNDEMLVIGAGIATHRKAPDLFVEVALECIRAGVPARFVWIGGEHDELFPKVCEQIDRLGLVEMTLLGNVADLDAWICAADLFLHTARLDAFPLVCLQSAALSVPVIGFAGTGWMEEMFGDAAVGATFPDVHGLSRIIASFADPDVRAAAAAGQRAAIGQHIGGDVAGPLILGVLVGP